MQTTGPCRAAIVSASFGSKQTKIVAPEGIAGGDEFFDLLGEGSLVETFSARKVPLPVCNGQILNTFGFSIDVPNMIAVGQS